MFKSAQSKKNHSPLINFFRLLLSVLVLLVFAIGAYQAFRYFSGVDPLKLSPQELSSSILAAPEVSSALHLIMGANLPKEITRYIPNNLPLSQLKPTLAEKPVPKGEMVLKFAIMADSHQDNDNLVKALSLAKEKGVKFVIGLGDYSETGERSELQKAKAVFQAANLPFYLTAGDHDLWAARNQGLNPLSYFSEIFGSAYQSFGDSNIRFIILFNSDNYLGIDPVQMSWLGEELDKAFQEEKRILVFLHEPLYHPTSNQVMGSARKNENQADNPTIIAQAEVLRKMFKQAQVEGVFAGDIHSFTQTISPEGLEMVTIGALTTERNTQSPRFALVEIYSEGGYNVEDIEIQ